MQTTVGVGGMEMERCGKGVVDVEKIVDPYCCKCMVGEEEIACCRHSANLELCGWIEECLC